MQVLVMYISMYMDYKSYFPNLVTSINAIMPALCVVCMNVSF